MEAAERALRTRERTGRPFLFTGHDTSRVALRALHAQRTGRTDADLPTLPGLDSYADIARGLPGGRAELLKYISHGALEQLPCCLAWWDIYMALLPSHRLRVSYGDVGYVAGVRPSQLMAEVIACAMEAGNSGADLTAAVMHPRVVHQLTKSAMRIAGEFADVAQRDRHAFLQGRGFLPTPKNATVHVHAQATANAAAAAQATADPSVPSFGSTMEALRPTRIGVQQQLEAARRELEPLEPLEALEATVFEPVFQDDDGG